MERKIVDPFLVFLPVIFMLITVVSSIVWIILDHINGILSFFKILIPVIETFTIIGLIGLLICLTFLLVKNTFMTYIRSIPLTLYLHENLKIYKKVSDYRNERQPFNYAERSYNSCIFNSYIVQTQSAMTVVIAIPRNGEAQEILNKKIITLRKDLISRFPEYSFSGKFDQFGGFKVLQGNLF